MIERVRLQRSTSIIDAINDDRLFAPWFKDRKTWIAWFAFLAALFGLPLTPKQLAIYRQCTGREDAPTEAAKEGWLVIGRRGGKSFIMALVAVFLACFKEYRQYLAPGERATVLVIARDRRQARIILRYVRALLTQVPMLSRMVQREWTEGFDLSNSVTIEVGTASFRSVRGYTIAASLVDELAFFPTDDSAEPDYEILSAIKPGMATIPSAILLCASSPYARRGALWDAHKRYFGKDGPVLVWQSDTRTMNPTVPQSFIDEQIERDPISAASEFGASFRSDIEAFLPREDIEACVSPGVYERPWMLRTRFQAFCDPSGGVGDSFGLAIGHREGDRAVVDCIREFKAPFSPEAIVQECAALLKGYRVSRVSGDKYAGEWPREAFRKCSITYDPCKLAKSDLYRDCVPIIKSKRADLLDSDRLVNQLVGLERRTARSGKDSIDHSPGSKDDLANSVAGLIATMTNVSGYDVAGLLSKDEAEDDARWRAHQRNLHMFGGPRPWWK